MQLLYHKHDIILTLETLIMVDTIVLMLPSSQFKIVKPNDFTPSTDLVYKNAAVRAVQNATTKEHKLGIYKPRLTITHRKIIDNRANMAGIDTHSSIALKIEFSAPKLLLGNNLEELQNKDFDRMITKLHERMLNMGVEIDQGYLKHAPVIAIHYAKNISLKDGSTPFHFISKIKQSYIPSRMDSNLTHYRNAGSGFKIHCNSHEIVFYDKLYDLHQSHISTKRSIDRDNSFDLKILDGIRTKKRKFEILRMEVRLNKRSKIKQLLSSINIKSDLTLRKLFKPAIAQKVLLHYVNQLECKRPALLELDHVSDKALLSTLVVHNPMLTPKQILQFFGFKKILETMTAEELKMILGKKHNRSWTRLLSDIQHIQLPITNSPFTIIKEQIQKYQPIKIRKTL